MIEKRYDLTHLNFTKTKDIMPYVDKMFTLFNGSYATLQSFVPINDIQIEYFNSKTDTASVRWINDCEMIFKTIRPKNLAEQKDVHVKILTTTKNSYKFEYGYVGDTNKQLGNATRID